MHAHSPMSPLSLRASPRHPAGEVDAAPDPLVLVVEDDAEIAALTACALGAHGLSTQVVGDADAMDRAIAWRRPDLVVLDVGLCGEDGLSACLRLRNGGGPPVILVSSRGDETDRILGLDMGATDYLSKPFNPRELVARIRAVLRRVPRAGARVPVRHWRFAGWTLDTTARRLTDHQGTVTPLTAAEFEMLEAFCRYPGQTLSRGRLRDITQGPDSVAQERSIDLAVRRLRVKIEPNPSNPSIIQTVRSYGYIFSVPLHPVL